MFLRWKGIRDGLMVVTGGAAEDPSISKEAYIRESHLPRRNHNLPNFQMQADQSFLSTDDFVTSFSDPYGQMLQDNSGLLPLVSSPSLTDVSASESNTSASNGGIGSPARMVRSNVPPSLLIGGSGAPQEFGAMPSPHASPHYQMSPYTADPLTAGSAYPNMMDLHSGTPFP